MATTLEQRVANLEKMVEELQQKKAKPHAWLDEIHGRYQDGDPFFEAMRLGREYRESLRPRAAKGRSKLKSSSKR